MLKKRLYFPVAILLMGVLAACNLPTPAAPVGPDAAFTAAAQTVVVQLTNQVLTQAAPGQTLTPTAAAQATATATPPALTATSTIKPTNTLVCDQAIFVTDVTVADGTEFEP